MTTPLTLRRQMVDSQLRARGIANPRVLDAMLRVPRHEFVPEPYRAESYDDHPLPIGDNQTISQPYVVAVMLEALDVTLNDAVLEIGTGSGYVTALLAELAAQVFSVERHLALAGNARQVLAALGYTNVRVFSGDGTLGLSQFIMSHGVVGMPRQKPLELDDGLFQFPHLGRRIRSLPARDLVVRLELQITVPCRGRIIQGS